MRRGERLLERGNELGLRLSTDSRVNFGGILERNVRKASFLINGTLHGSALLRYRRLSRKIAIKGHLMTRAKLFPHDEEPKSKPNPWCKNERRRSSYHPHNIHSPSKPTIFHSIRDTSHKQPPQKPSIPKIFPASRHHDTSSFNVPSKSTQRTYASQGKRLLTPNRLSCLRPFTDPLFPSWSSSIFLSSFSQMQRRRGDPCNQRKASRGKLTAKC